MSPWRLLWGLAAVVVLISTAWAGVVHALDTEDRLEEIPWTH